MNRIPLYYSAANFDSARRTGERGLHGHSFKLEGLFDDLESAQALSSYATQLDLMDLNDCLSSSEDYDILSWALTQCDNVQELKLSSRQGEGCYWKKEGEILHWISDRFEAAHHLPHVPEGHKCGRLHGHGFGVTLLGAQGTSRIELEEIWKYFKQELDGTYLNELKDLSNPTSEVLAQWLWDRIRHQFTEVSQVMIQETATAGCAYDGKLHRIWKRQDAESALYIPSQDTPLGHSYQIRLHIQGDLDPIMGWTVDYGDVKALFKPLYEQLDHHCLNEMIDGEPTSLNVAKWIFQQLKLSLPALYRVDVFDTERTGLVYSEHYPVASSPRLMV